jgi:hypothetical protein
MLQGGERGITNERSVVLEDEVGSYGTALTGQQQENADQEFDDTFQDDPGHISRGEIRFNAALRAMGGRNPGRREQRRRGSRLVLERRVDLHVQQPTWTAIEEPEQKRPKANVAVNIMASVPSPAPAPPSHLGMSDKEARSDLNSYFSSLSSETLAQEKKHDEYRLNQLAGKTPGSAQARAEGSAQETNRQFVRSHKQLLADEKVSALMNLVRKAAASKQFQAALVGASKSRYRGSVVGDFE